MSVVRIAGLWHMSTMTVQNNEKCATVLDIQMTLEVTKSTRTTVEAVLRDGKLSLPFSGRLKIGSPPTVVLSELDNSGSIRDGGAEILFYLLPFWPNIDYKYDSISGTIGVGSESAIASHLSFELPAFFCAVKHWEE